MRANALSTRARTYQYPGVKVHLHRGGPLLAPASAGRREVLEPLVGHLKLDRPDLVLLDELLQQPPLALAILHLLRQLVGGVVSSVLAFCGGLRTKTISCQIEPLPRMPYLIF